MGYEPNLLIEESMSAKLEKKRPWWKF